MTSAAAWLHVSDDQGETPYSRTIKSGFQPAIELILYVLEPADTSNDLPIHVAARESRVEEVKRLLEEGADINAQDTNGLTALHWAAITGNVDLAKLLVNRNAHINPREENITDLTPTALAQALGYEELTAYLVSNGGLE